MVKGGLALHEYVYGELIHGWCMKKHQSCLCQMEPRGVTYDTMIHSYCEEDNSYRALKLLKEMDVKGWVPNMATNS